MQHGVAPKERVAHGLQHPSARVWGQKLGQPEEAWYQTQIREQDFLMNRRRSILASIACVCVLLVALTGCSLSPNSYHPEKLEPTIKPPAIGKEGVLRVGIGGGAPFLATSDASNTTGLSVDVAAAIAQQLGLKLEVVTLGTNGSDVNIESALKKGDVDIVMNATKSNASANVWVSSPYLQSAVCLFAPENSKVPMQDSAPKIAVQAASTSSWAVSNTFGDKSIDSKGDLLSALSSVETKDAPYLAADYVIGTYAALGQNVSVSPIAVLGPIDGYAIAASASNSALQHAINEAISTLNANGVLKAVTARWIGEGVDLVKLPHFDVTTTKNDSESDVASSTSDKTSEASQEDADTPRAGVQGMSAQGAGAAGSVAGANAITPHN